MRSRHPGCPERDRHGAVGQDDTQVEEQSQADDHRSGEPEVEHNECAHQAVRDGQHEGSGDSLLDAGKPGGGCVGADLKGQSEEDEPGEPEANPVDVLQAPAANQSLIEKRFDILVKNKRARPGNFLLVNFRGNFRGIILGKSSFRPHLSTRNSQRAVWHDRQ